MNRAITGHGVRKAKPLFLSVNVSDHVFTERSFHMVDVSGSEQSVVGEKGYFT